MDKNNLENKILELGLLGCSGNPGDFASWIESINHSPVNLEDVKIALKNLINNSKFHYEEKPVPSYSIHNDVEYSDNVEYTFSAYIKHAPIQYIRSRLESFLIYHNADPSAIIDILIAITEAVENSVKYSKDKLIHVSYKIQDRTFKLKMENNVAEISLEDDIATGKFDSTKTLMRGIMVMNKLFDTMNIDFSEDNKTAILIAEKNI